MSELERIQAEYLGLFSYHLGIKPWEWDDLDLWQVHSLVAFVDSLEKQR